MFKYLFDLGAIAAVHVPNGLVVSKGGKATLQLKGTGSYDRYHFDRTSGPGQYRKTGGDLVDKDGWYGSDRTNYWNLVTLNLRGFTSLEAGATVQNEVFVPNDWIIGNLGSGYGPDAFRVVNGGVGFRGAGQSAVVSDTFSMVLSFWVRKPDKSTVSGTDCYVHMSDSAVWSDPNIAGATHYEKFRDGWYRVWAVVPPCSSTAARVQGIKVAQGGSVYLDLPQHERFGASTPGPTEPIMTDSSADRARVQYVLECFLRGAAGHGPHLQAGAIAIACSPERAAVEQTFGQLLLYGDTDTNHGIVASDTSDRLAAWTRIATVSTAFIDADDPGAFAHHTPIGACFQWGQAGPGVGDYFAAANGVRAGWIQSAPALPALATARLLIGGRLSAVDVASSAANARVMIAAIFGRKPGHQACMKISRWMQEKAQNYWRWQ